MERILREYDEIKRDSTYLNARARMQYLHQKLSHIKTLILAFNQSPYRVKHTAGGRGLATGTGSANCGNSSSSSIKFNALGSGGSSHVRSKHGSVPAQQSNRSKMITSS